MKVGLLAKEKENDVESERKLGGLEQEMRIKAERQS